MTRDRDIMNFLAKAGWQDAHRAKLAGDASNRRYERLHHATKGRAVLMDAAPDRGEDVAPFIAITQYLTDAGLSAPLLMAADTDHGFLLLEDFGDALFDRVIAQNPDTEPELYHTAWSTLLQIWDQELPDNIAPYDPADMADKAGLVADWYDPNLDRHAIEGAISAALSDLSWDRPTLALRDFHAQNLIWLPGRQGPARVGLLDYQDAQPSHVLYDLVSLLFDARRDVSPELRNALLDVARHDTALPDFDAAVAALLAQRSLRILGVFARLNQRDKKPGYLDLIPRVFEQLQHALKHPSLQPLAHVLRDIAQPDATYLATLRARA